MTPRSDGVLIVKGIVGRDIDAAQARTGAALAARNALAAISAEIGGSHNIKRCLRMTVYIAIDDGFEDLSLIADAASDALAEHFGERFQPPVRSAIGVRGLPSGAPVEIELTVAVRRGQFLRRFAKWAGGDGVS